MEIEFLGVKNKQSLKNKITKWFSSIKNPLGYFLFLCLIGFGFYFLMLVENNFTLAYSGDYSAQYIPMSFHIWDLYHTYFETGHFTLFDNAIYLGANSIASNAYYGVFSPFNIIIVIFPRDWVPFTMVISSIVKIAVGCIVFSKYLRYLNVKKEVSNIVGIMYGFSGWMAFYLWFNNYQDIIVFFPLILLGIEKLLKEKKPFLLIISIALLEIVNYVLFVPYIICSVLYAGFRYFQSLKNRDAKENIYIGIYGVVSYLVGIFIGLAIFLPSFVSTISSPKLDNSNSYTELIKNALNNKDFAGFLKLLFSFDAVPDQHGDYIGIRQLFPILEFFFPATTCRSLPTLEYSGWDFDDMAVSLWTYTPTIIFFIPTIMKSFKEKKISHLVGLGLMLLILFTPFMYFLTMGFTNGYARWTLFVITSLLAYISYYLNDYENIKLKEILIGAAFAIIGITFTFIFTMKYGTGDIQVSTRPYSSRATLSYRLTDDDKNITVPIFIAEYVYVLLVLGVLIITNKKKVILKTIKWAVICEAIAMGSFVTIGHSWDSNYNNGYYFNSELKYVLNNIDKQDSGFYRVHTSLNNNWSNNNGLMNDYSGTSYFHSLYNFNIDDFTLWTKMRSSSKAVSGIYRGKIQDLDNLLGIKYYVLKKEDIKYDYIKNNPNFRANVPLNFTIQNDLETQDFIVYKSNAENDFAIAYDSIYSYDEETYFPNNQCQYVTNPILMNQSAILYRADADKILANNSNITTYSGNNLNTLKNLSESNYNVSYYRSGVFARDLKVSDLENIYKKPRTDSNFKDFDSEESLHYVKLIERNDDSSIGEFDNGVSLYFEAPFSSSEKYRFYFLDENGKVFMYDYHDQATTDNPIDWRGFYSTIPVKAIMITGTYPNSSVKKIQLNGGARSESGANYLARINTQKNNTAGIKDVVYNQDNISFKTDYENEKVVVTKMAYDSGWSIKRINLNNNKKEYIPIFKGNGGFVSFLAEKGNYEYHMEYEPEYLRISTYISEISFIGFIISLCGYHINNERKSIEDLLKLENNK